MAQSQCVAATTRIALARGRIVHRGMRRGVEILGIKTSRCRTAQADNAYRTTDKPMGGTHGVIQLPGSAS